MAKTDTTSRPVNTIPKTLLDPADVAAELNIGNLAVYRLIARGRLVATRLEDSNGQRRQVKIKRADFEAFFNDDDLGDVRIPADNDGSWFESDSYPAKRAGKLLLDNVPPDATLRAELIRSARSSTLSDLRAVKVISVDVNVNDAMREAFNGPMVVGFQSRIRVQGSGGAVAKSLLECFVQERARKFAKRFMVDRYGVVPKRSFLTILYDNPKLYREIFDYATAQVRGHVFSKNVSRVFNFATQIENTDVPEEIVHGVKVVVILNAKLGDLVNQTQAREFIARAY